MKNVLLLLIHLLTVVAKLLGPGGIKGSVKLSEIQANWLDE